MGGGGHLYESKIDFGTITKRDVFRTFSNVL